ncbi:hypothetical protein [Streptomyces sp. NRRL B-24720]|uniref:hypothetical protein n=1 Tax=Streptomyces sp. NRRL B-24720 TaxID=1476876 RepID=UPI0004C708F1|nr:hypothetical protein [Streptomyces sp. NRRL B-24720]
MGPIEIAEDRARETSEDPALFMRAYAAGWNTAVEGRDVSGEARRLASAIADAGFIEGVAAFRALSAKTRDFVPYSGKQVTT